MELGDELVVVVVDLGARRCGSNVSRAATEGSERGRIVKAHERGGAGDDQSTDAEDPQTAARRQRSHRGAGCASARGLIPGAAVGRHTWLLYGRPVPIERCAPVVELAAQIARMRRGWSTDSIAG